MSSLIWSPDSHYLMVVIRKRSTIVIKSISDNEWMSKIEQGLAGLSEAFWLPDSAHIAAISEFKLKMTIYSLIDKSISYISNPKGSWSFSKNGLYMVVLERHE